MPEKNTSESRFRRGGPEATVVKRYFGFCSIKIHISGFSLYFSHIILRQDVKRITNAYPKIVTSRNLLGGGQMFPLVPVSYAYGYRRLQRRKRKQNRGCYADHRGNRSLPAVSSSRPPDLWSVKPLPWSLSTLVLVLVYMSVARSLSCAALSRAILVSLYLSSSCADTSWCLRYRSSASCRQQHTGHLNNWYIW